MHTASPADGKKGEAASQPTPAPAKADRDRGPIYNVYAQPIDPKNMMPPPNQAPSPGQKKPLSTTRVQSTIPKGGTVDNTWLYPSPQIFYNALVRKNKAQNVDEDDMDIVVAIHNEMNERTWRKLLQWEDMHKSEHLDGEPALRRFMGKPYDLSPKAKIKSYLGYGFPFDRHDWYVDRNGKEVRYVIDYYYSPDPNADVAGKPVGGIVPEKTKSIHVDVRPAVDSLDSVIDRLKMFPGRAWEALMKPKFAGEGIDPSKAPQEAAAFALHSSDQPSVQGHGATAAAPAVVAPVAAPAAAGPTRVAAAPESEEEDGLMANIQAKCGAILGALQAERDGDKKRELHMAFNYCMGKELCPKEAMTFMKTLESSSELKASASEEVALKAQEDSFLAMTQCVFDRMKRDSAERAAKKAAGGAAAAPMK